MDELLREELFDELFPELLDELLLMEELRDDEPDELLTELLDELRVELLDGEKRLLVFFDELLLTLLLELMFDELPLDDLLAVARVELLRVDEPVELLRTLFVVEPDVRLDELLLPVELLPALAERMLDVDELELFVELPLTSLLVERLPPSDVSDAVALSVTALVPLPVVVASVVVTLLLPDVVPLRDEPPVVVPRCVPVDEDPRREFVDVVVLSLWLAVLLLLLFPLYPLVVELHPERPPLSNSVRMPCPPLLRAWP